MLKEKKTYQFYTQKISFKYEEELMTFPENKKIKKICCQKVCGEISPKECCSGRRNVTPDKNLDIHKEECWK